MIITILRKPLEGPVAENTLKHGCGGLNIDATRVGYNKSENLYEGDMNNKKENMRQRVAYSNFDGVIGNPVYKEKGRWPANFILTHKDGYYAHSNRLKGNCFFWSAVKAAKNPDLQLMAGQHKKQVKGDTRHFWLEDKQGNIIDPTASQVNKSEYLQGRPISLGDNVDFVLTHPLFENLSDKDKEAVRVLPPKPKRRRADLAKELGEIKGTKKIKSSGWRDIDVVVQGVNPYEDNINSTTSKHYSDDEGDEEVVDWDCEEGCPVRELDLQSGGTSRFFKQFKKDNDQ